MPIDEKLLKLLHKTIDYLKDSNESTFADQTPKELIAEINNCIKQNNKQKINILFMPTAPLQDTAIDNGWGDEYCKIATEVKGLL